MIPFSQQFLRIINSVLVLFVTLNSFSQKDLANWENDIAPIEPIAVKIDSLESIINSMIRSNYPNQEKALQKFIEFNIQEGDYDRAAQKSRFLIQDYIFKGELEKASEALNQMLSHKDQFKEIKSEAHLILKRAQLYFLDEDLEKAINDYKTVAPMFFEANDSIYGADAYYFTAQAYNDLSNPVEAVKNYQIAYRLFTELGDKEYAKYVKLEMSDFYNKNGMKERAMEAWKEVSEASKADNLSCPQLFADAVLFQENVSTLSEIEFKDALAEINNLLEACKAPEIINRLRASTNWAVTKYYLDNNEPEKAKVYYEIARETDDRFTSKYDRGQFVNYEAEYLVSIGEVEKAANLLSNYLNEPEKTPTIYKIKLMQQLVNISKINNDKELRLKYADELLRLKDSLFEASVAHNYALNQSLFELEEKDQKILKNKLAINELEVESDKLKSRTLVTAIIVALILVILVGGLVLYRRRVKKQIITNSQLSEQIGEKTKEIDKLIVDSVKEFKKKEYLEEQLQQLSKGNSEISINSIISDIKASKNDDEKRLILTQNLEKVSANFNEKLKASFPNLTKTELEVIDFIKLGMSRAEIAQIRKTSVDAVKKSRSRIKKKLNLKPGESLDDFIINF